MSERLGLSRGTIQQRLHVRYPDIRYFNFNHGFTEEDYEYVKNPLKGYYKEYKKIMKNHKNT